MALEKRRQDSNDNVHQAIVLYYTLTETTIVSCRAPFLCDLDGAGYQNRRRVTMGRIPTVRIGLWLPPYLLNRTGMLGQLSQF